MEHKLGVWSCPLGSWYLSFEFYHKIQIVIGEIFVCPAPMLHYMQMTYMQSKQAS